MLQIKLKILEACDSKLPYSFSTSVNNLQIENLKRILMWTHPHRPNAPVGAADNFLMETPELTAIAAVPMAAMRATSEFHHSSLTSVSLSLASRADRGPLVLSLILSLSWMAFIQASAFSTLLSNSSCSCWVIALEEAERTGNKEVSRFWVRPEQEWKAIQRSKGEKLMMLWISFWRITPKTAAVSLFSWAQTIYPLCSFPKRKYTRKQKEGGELWEAPLQ